MRVHIEAMWGPRLQDTTECAVLIRRFLDRAPDIAPCLAINGRWLHYPDAVAEPDHIVVVDDSVAGLTALLDSSRSYADEDDPTVTHHLRPEVGSHLDLSDDRELGLSLHVRCGAATGPQKNTLMLDLPEPSAMHDDERVLGRPDVIEALLRVLIEETRPDTAGFFDLKLYQEQLRSPLTTYARQKHEQYRRRNEVRLGWLTFIAGDPSLDHSLLPDIATVTKTLGGKLIRLGDDPLGVPTSAVLDLRLALGYPPMESAWRGQPALSSWRP